MRLLFDIDETLLVGVTHEHRDAIHEALRRGHGVGDPRSARVSADRDELGDIGRAGAHEWLGGAAV